MQFERFYSLNDSVVGLLPHLHHIDRNCDVLPVEYDIFRSLIDVGVKFGLRKIIHEVK
jgi:hypothetical protein